MARGTERNEARGEVGSGLHGELFISSTFTYSDPPLWPAPVIAQVYLSINSFKVNPSAMLNLFLPLHLGSSLKNNMEETINTEKNNLSI